jgi:hypothetical protein
MIIKTLKAALIVAAAAGTLSAIAPTAASAHGFYFNGGHYYGGHWHTRFWGPNYRGLRYWGHGIVLQNGCPVGYVRDGGLCFPTF